MVSNRAASNIAAPTQFLESGKQRYAYRQTQADKLIFNPAGYHNNVARPLILNVV